MRGLIHPVRTILALMALAAAPVAASAQDEGLYEAAPPPDAAFVRVIHAAPGTDTVDATLGEVGLDGIEYGETTPYVTVMKGDQEILIGEVSQTVTIGAGRFYTLALVASSEATIEVIEDDSNTNQTKALVAFYNFTDQEGLWLGTADGRTEVVTDVAQNGAQFREVNPVNVELGVFDGETAVGSFDAVQLERGRAYSAVVVEGDGAPRAIWVVDTTEVR